MELSTEFLLLVGVGLLAQTIDGALGMAYGLTASSVLATLGMPPALVSATVHTAEVFTTGVSGLSHAWFRNLDRHVFFAIVLPGVCGGIAGALLLTHIPGDKIKPFVFAYLFVAALAILRRGLSRTMPPRKHIPAIPLGIGAGFLDAVGGGGWGTMMTTALVNRGVPVRFAVGTANAAEFFVTVAIAGTLFTTLDFRDFTPVLALIIGGVIGAPFSAYVTKYLPARVGLLLVGILVMGLSARGIILALMD